jgi:hypothetical protein
MAGHNRINQQIKRIVRLANNSHSSKRKRIKTGSGKVKQVILGKHAELKKNQRAIFETLTPNNFVRAGSERNGVDYKLLFKTHKGIAKVTFDFKFSYGESGLRTICPRVERNRLVNSSDWTMVMNRKGIIELFETKHLENFIRTKWGTVSKKNRIEKKDYVMYPISLDTIYMAEGIKPIKCLPTRKSIESALYLIETMHIPKKVQKNLNKKESKKYKIPNKLQNPFFSGNPLTKKPPTTPPPKKTNKKAHRKSQNNRYNRRIDIQ